MHAACIDKSAQAAHPCVHSVYACSIRRWWYRSFISCFIERKRKERRKRYFTNFVFGKGCCLIASFTACREVRLLIRGWPPPSLAASPSAPGKGVPSSTAGLVPSTVSAMLLVGLLSEFSNHYSYWIDYNIQVP